MNKILIELAIDLDRMKIVATHNIPEIFIGKGAELKSKVYNRVLQGVCRSFGGIIYALIKTKKDTIFFENDKMQALSMISRSIEEELKQDVTRNKPTVSH